MIKNFRPALLATALLLGAAPVFAQGVTSTPAPANTSPGTSPGTSTQRPVAAAPATPAAPGGLVATQRPANGTVQAPVRPAQPSGTAATTPAPMAPRTN